MAKWWGERGGRVQQNVCGLTVCFACTRRQGQLLAGRMALLVAMLGKLGPSAAGVRCLCLSLPFLLAVAAGSSSALRSPVLAHPLALLLPFLWQEQPAQRSRWQNSVFSPLSLPCTSLFVSIFLSTNLMQCLY